MGRSHPVADPTNQKENQMLINPAGAIVTFNSRQRKICDEGLAAIMKVEEGLNKDEQAAINARRNILLPLKEKHVQPNPCGRGLTIFSLEERAKFIPNKNRCFA